MKPWQHARGSVARWGGREQDYLKIHDFIDQTKIAMPDLRHRAVLHNAFGCFLVERVFGHVLVNSAGRSVSTRDVAEQHIIEDMGFIPSLEDWLDELPQQPWHGGIHRLPKDKRPKKEASYIMALKTMIENITKARQAYEEQKKALGDSAGKAVAETLGPFLPLGYAMVWDQYTPYFNDGDPCTFSVHTHRPFVRLTKMVIWMTARSTSDGMHTFSSGLWKSRDILRRSGKLSRRLGKNFLKIFWRWRSVITQKS